jgi:hypothetical protein
MILLQSSMFTVFMLFLKGSGLPYTLMIPAFVRLRIEVDFPVPLSPITRIGIAIVSPLPESRHFPSYDGNNYF